MAVFGNCWKFSDLFQYLFHFISHRIFVYAKTNIVDLRTNVVLVTSDSIVLNAEQLYWDQKNQWVFTDQPYRIKFKDGSYNDGARFDSSEDFTNFISRKNQGVQIIDQKNTDEN